GKACAQTAAAQTDPLLVAVPARRDRVPRRVSLLSFGKEGKEDADAEIEAIHHDVREHRERQDDQPNRRQIEEAAHGRASSSACPIVRSGSTAGAGVIPAARKGSGSASGPGSPG